MLIVLLLWPTSGHLLHVSLCEGCQIMQLVSRSVTFEGRSGSNRDKSITSHVLCAVLVICKDVLEQDIIQY